MQARAQVLPCDEGMFLNPVFGNCTLCPPGFSTNTTVATISNSALLQGGLDSICDLLVFPCAPCPAGTAPNANRTACVECTAGFFAPTVGSPSCLRCPLGEITSDAGCIACTPCPRGTMTNTNRTSCILCRAGTFGPDIGSPLCFNCPPGQVSVSGSAHCVNCPPGTYGSGSSCIECPKGHFSDTAGALFCRPCPADTCASELGSVHCTRCLPGSWAPVGSSTCYWNTGYTEYW